MKCNSCAKELVEDARFCPRCGRSVVVPDGAILTGAGERSSLEAGQTGRESEAHSLLPSSEALLSDRVALLVGASGENGSSGHPVREQAAGAQSVPTPGVVARESGKVLTSPFPVLPDTSGSVSVPGKRLNGSAIHTLLAQANLHRIRKEWTQGIDCCVVVLRAQPANQTAHVVLGDIYRDQRRLDEAIQWYQMAVELRPNPTDEAKLEGVRAERERQNRQNARRKQQGYVTTGASAVNRGTDLNTGTTNLMGISPRRWLRGITGTALGFVTLMLLFMIVITLRQNQNQNRPGTPSKTVSTPASAANVVGQGSGLPPHRNDRTSPDYSVNALSNSGKPIIVGGGGLPPDRQGAGTLNSAAAGQATSAFPSRGDASALPPDALPSRPAQGAPGLASRNGINPAAVQGVRPLNGEGGGAVQSAPTAPPSTQLTDGVQITQTNGTVVVLTAPATLVADGRGEEILIRNLYRAARTLCAGNSLATSVQVFVQAQSFNPNVSGRVVVMEGTLDRSIAIAANPDTDAISSLQAGIRGFRWSGGATSAPSANSTSSDSPDNGGSTQ